MQPDIFFKYYLNWFNQKSEYRINNINSDTII